MTFIKAISFILLSSTSLFALSQTYNCPDMTINLVSIQNNRDDVFMFENKMVISLDGLCAGKEYVHIGVDNPVMNSFLSIVLSARAMGKKVNVGVNTNNQTDKSNQFAYISLAD